MNGNGIHPSEDKIEAVAKMNPPSDVSGVRRFLGLVNYMGRFIPNLSELLQPLNELLKKEKVFIWGPAQQESFERVKKILTQEPTLAMNDPAKNFHRKIFSYTRKKLDRSRHVVKTTARGSRRPRSRRRYNCLCETSCSFTPASDEKLEEICKGQQDQYLEK